MILYDSPVHLSKRKAISKTHCTSLFNLFLLSKDDIVRVDLLYNYIIE